MSRKPLSQLTKIAILTESGFRCAVPTCRTILVLDIHHIEEISEGGMDEESNLIALCPNCHALYHRQKIPRESLRVWKGILVSLNGAFDKNTIDDLIFLKELTPNTLALSGDGVLKFSKLIAAGLASFKVFKSNGPLITYTVELTQKGNLLVDAWKAGDKSSLESLIGSVYATIDLTSTSS